MTTLTKIRRGNDYSIPISLLDSAGAAVDTTGGTVKFRARLRGAASGSASTIDVDSDGSEITIVSHAAGTSTLDLTDAVTDALTAGQIYCWEVLLLDAAGLLTTYDTGEFLVLDSLFAS